MTIRKEIESLYIVKSNIGFEFLVNPDINYNFIHPVALFYWLIEAPRVCDWNAPFDSDFCYGETKLSLHGQGIERAPRELVKCSDGIFRTCAKVIIQVSCNGTSYNVAFYVDKTLQHAGTIGSELENIIKRNE